MKKAVLLGIGLLALGATGALAEVSSTWVKSKAECKYRSGERDEFAIFGRTISNLEFECQVKSRSYKNGYTVDKALCGGEGMYENDVIRYRVDSNGALHIRINKRAEEIYRYSCR